MIDEKLLLPVLASTEASAMWQIPHDVHLLAACLGRLTALSPVFASQLAMSEVDARRWAAENLHSLWPRGNGRYLGPLDMEYDISGDGGRFSIAGRARGEGEVEPGDDPMPLGSPIITGYPPSWEAECKRTEAEMRAFVYDSTSMLDNDAPAGVVVLSVLLRLMEKPEIQQCLMSL